jgi:hypothetical protein
MKRILFCTNRSKYGTQISYVTDCEAVWNLFYIETDVSELASLALPMFRSVSFISFGHMVSQVL